MDTDLLMLNYQLSVKRCDLVNKRNNVKVRIRNMKRRMNSSGSIHLSTLETSYLTYVDEIKIIDQQLQSKKNYIISLEKEIVAETKLLQKTDLEVKTIQWN